MCGPNLNRHLAKIGIQLGPREQKTAVHSGPTYYILLYIISYYSMKQFSHFSCGSLPNWRQRGVPQILPHLATFVQQNLQPSHTQPISTCSDLLGWGTLLNALGSDLMKVSVPISWCLAPPKKKTNLCPKEDLFKWHNYQTLPSLPYSNPSNSPRDEPTMSSQPSLPAKNGKEWCWAEWNGNSWEAIAFAISLPAQLLLQWNGKPHLLICHGAGVVHLSHLSHVALVVLTGLDRRIGYLGSICGKLSQHFLDD